MRSAFRFLTVAALALMLVSLGFAQNQTSVPPDPNATSNAPSNATSNPPAQDTSTPAPPDKPDKNAPPPNRFRPHTIVKVGVADFGER